MPLRSNFATMAQSMAGAVLSVAAVAAVACSRLAIDIGKGCSGRALTMPLGEARGSSIRGRAGFTLLRHHILLQ
ncbi:hypothetical protein [Streptomyces sp. NBC_01450]|uniref:hypothetical protein n=1 Tax=Streptomyces sp. NBC_01450 TaxID=2903871 RepID=UPI003FCD5058